ncbi:hypothetical protein QMK19_39510 [Streptomyces sp. H10-C2]|uniref:DUF7739 domain-containing protein n=1 Tax=unclassified Streptomyces TaxID=2593676 RepID=UPI0024BB02FA|nr:MULTISPECIES: hypothetical protein [unclassified Streptomyces]MDJ0347280.1 hypothetical protein [Streptomyces sp. PH10-H1]MDJ0375514.1 hypothetical protein [Streptomyces sp. H10-C2]
MTHTHIVTSHGADFFGVDTHPTKNVRALADHARGVLPYDGREPLTRLLESAGTQPETEVPADQADVLADLLGKVAAHRFTKPKAAVLARLLADSAARAAAEGESWTWTTSTAAVVVA